MFYGAAVMNMENVVEAFVQAVEQATELELVRRGFDPGQVQSLVGSLAGELKNMAAENERLKGRITELEQAPTKVKSDEDVFAHWSTETNALLDAARASIARVTEDATTNAASAVSAGEMAATAIRQRAQIDADQLIAEARRQADASVEEAAKRAQEMRTAAEADQQRRSSAAQADLDVKTTEHAAVQAKIDDLKSQRSMIKDQLTTAQTHIMQLLALVHSGDEAAQAPDEQS